MSAARFTRSRRARIYTASLGVNTTLLKDVPLVGLVSVAADVGSDLVQVIVSGSSRGKNTTAYNNIEGVLKADGAKIEGFYAWNYADTQATSWGCTWAGALAPGNHVFSVDLVLRSYISAAAETYIRPLDPARNEHLRVTVLVP